VSGLWPRTVLGRLATYRVPLAGGLVALSVAAALSALAPAEAAAVAVVVAARDLPSGALLEPADLALVRVPAVAVPAGAVEAVAHAVGTHVSGAVRAGETLTDVRLLGAGLVPAGDQVAVPVRVAEPAVAGLLRPGDRVDVLSADPDGGQAARTVVADVVVLAVPELGENAFEGALLVLAADRGGASRLAAAAVTGRLSVVVRGR
jgi:pilus assembly protein CpaB